jgi:hypothetical protein
MKLMGRAALGLAAAAMLMSCAGSAVRRSAYELRDTKHNEILLLHGNIINYRKEMGLADQPNHNLIQRAHMQPVRPSPPEPAADAPAVCQDVCDLADRICEAQEDICKIAQELGPEDTWAQEKCDSAKASCEEARKRCMDCPSGSAQVDEICIPVRWTATP